MIRRPPRSTQSRSSAASDVYKRQVSENTARDLRHFYRTIECRPLRIAHNAVDSLFTPSSVPEIEELLHELELPREYCVFVGARDVPYKNASLVFDALPLLCTEQRPAILCVGGLPTLEAEVEARAAAATVRVASLSDAQLLSLIHI